MADVDQLKKDLWTHMARSPFVMVGLEGRHSEPLTAQLDEDQADTLWFFVAKDNRLIGGGAAVAQYVSKGHDYFACLAGEIREVDDRAMIEKLALRSPIYRQTTNYGHFGKPGLAWEA